MKFEKFSLILKDVFGVRIKFHWSIILVIAIISYRSFEPVFCLSIFTIILIHEFGHALIVKIFSLKNHELIIHGVGGVCVWSGHATEMQSCLIAWGGIIAQLVLFIIFVSLSEFVDIPKIPYMEQIFRAFIMSNLFIMIFNLIPTSPFDGAEAWKILKPVWKDIKSIKNSQKANDPNEIVQQQLRKIFDENDVAPNNRSQRTRYTRR